MKKNIYILFTVITAMLSLGVLSSCEQLKQPEGENTEDTGKIDEQYDLAPGTVITYEFTPSSVWTISISEESYKWFKIKDGKFNVASLTGRSSAEPVTITIETASDESFALRTCDLMLTMNGKTEVVAKYSLKPLGRVVETYAVKLTEEGGFDSADGKYLFNEEPMSDSDVIELKWDANERKYSCPIMIRSNFEWDVEWPSWARADITQSSRKEIALEIYAIPSEMPLEASEAEIRFKNEESVLKTVKIRFEGVKDRFEFGTGGETSLLFDHAGYNHGSSGSYSKLPVDCFIYGTKTSRALLLELTEDGYAEPAQSSWLNFVETQSWDGIQGAPVLQQRNYEISAPKYTGSTDRNALLLLLPGTAPAELSEILSADKMGVNPDYARYAITIRQTARPAEFITFEEVASVYEGAGITFEKTDNLLSSQNFVFAEGMESWQYNLTYSKEMASSKSPLYITEPYETVEVYDADGNLVTEDLTEHWLSYSPLGEGLYGQFVMDKTYIPSEFFLAIDGYLVFKNIDNKVIAIVHCFYKAEIKSDVDVLEDVTDDIFEDPAAATAAGASIFRVHAGPTYEAHKEHQAPIYIIKYTVDNTSLMVKTSVRCQQYSCLGKPEDGPEMVTVDDQMFKDWAIYERIEEYKEDLEAWKKGVAEGKIDPNVTPEPLYPDTADERSTMGLLKFGATSFEERVYPGVSKINMTMPEGNTTYEEVIQFTTSESILFVFICQLDLSNSAQ
jgi:hypothetical protein